MNRKSTGVRLGAGEMEILEMLWREASATISHAHQSLTRKVGYTTVQTRLNRLVEKGLVTKTGSHPARYAAAIRPEDVTRDDLNLLLQRVTGGKVVPLVAHLVKDRSLSKDEIRELKRLIGDVERSNRKQQSEEND